VVCCRWRYVDWTWALRTVAVSSGSATLRRDPSSAPSRSGRMIAVSGDRGGSEHDPDARFLHLQSEPNLRPWADVELGDAS
jgi:hypothetical protein